MSDDKTLELQYANIDLDRTQRTGMQEVVYCGHKSPEQICGIVSAMLERGLHSILLTRLDEDAAHILADHIGAEFTTEAGTAPEAGSVSDAVTTSGAGSNECAAVGTQPGYSLYYDRDGRIAVVDWQKNKSPVGGIVIVSAGTSDMPVVREAAVTAEVLGNRVKVINDVGVAGIHRLIAREDEIRAARVVIVVAGMEGALASVVGGLVGCPVIAVPTSVGYGASFEGISALLSMLNSCAAGVSVVNIDNGFGAAVSASRINQMTAPE